MATAASLHQALQFVAFTVLTVFIFFILTLLNGMRPKAIMPIDLRLIVTGVFATFLVVLKALTETVWQVHWFWCPCHFDFIDVFLSLDGVLGGMLIIISVELMQRNKCGPCCRDDNNDAATAAMTLEPEEWWDMESSSNQIREDPLKPTDVSLSETSITV